MRMIHNSMKGACVPRFDHLESRVAMSCVINLDPQGNLAVQSDGANNQIEVGTMESGNGDKVHISVTCDGMNQQYDTDKLSSVTVRSEGVNNTVRVNIQASTEASVHMT